MVDSSALQAIFGEEVLKKNPLQSCVFENYNKNELQEKWDIKI